MSDFNFEDRFFPMDPKKVLIEYLKHNSDIFKNILEKREDVYKVILEDILLEDHGKYNLESFIAWYRQYMYDY